MMQRCNKIIVLFIIFTLYSSVLYPQNKLNDLDLSLLQFLIKNETILDSNNIERLQDYLFITELNKKDTVIIKPGIYKFGVTVTHTKRYIVCIDHNQIKIVNFNSIEDGIIELFDFFEKHKFKRDERIEYLKNILKVLDNNENIKKYLLF